MERGRWSKVMMKYLVLLRNSRYTDMALMDFAKVRQWKNDPFCSCYSINSKQFMESQLMIWSLRSRHWSDHMIYRSEVNSSFAVTKLFFIQLRVNKNWEHIFWHSEKMTPSDPFYSNSTLRQCPCDVARIRRCHFCRYTGSRALKQLNFM